MAKKKTVDPKITPPPKKGKKISVTGVVTPPVSSTTSAEPAGPGSRSGDADSGGKSTIKPPTPVTGSQPGGNPPRAPRHN